MPSRKKMVLVGIAAAAALAAGAPMAFAGDAADNGGDHHGSTTQGEHHGTPTKGCDLAGGDAGASSKLVAGTLVNEVVQLPVAQSVSSAVNCTGVLNDVVGNSVNGVTLNDAPSLP